MARVMSIRLVGQMSLFARWDDGEWVNLGMGRVAIGSDGVAKRLALWCATWVWS